MKEIVDLLINNSIGVVCIAYFMVRDWKFMSTMQQTLTELNITFKTILEIGGIKNVE